MKIQGDHTFPEPRPLVWRALLDPDVLSRTLPGCERLERVGENTFAGALKIKVGPVQGVFDGKVHLSELRPDEGYRLTLDGQGAPGFVKGEGTVELGDAEGGGTTLTYDLDAQVGGRIASVGQRLLDSSSKVITREALEGLGRQLEALAAEATGEDVAPVEQRSQGELAAEVAKGVVADLVPPERRPLAIGVAIAVLALVVYALMRFL